MAGDAALLGRDRAAGRVHGAGSLVVDSAWRDELRRDYLSGLAGPHHPVVRAGNAVAAAALRCIPADVQQDGNAGRRKRARQGGQPATPIELGAIIIGALLALLILGIDRKSTRLNSSH